MDPSSISVLVTFVGGPADGLTKLLPLTESAGTITVDSVAYRTNPGPPPEIKQTAQGAAAVMRPVHSTGK
jgi:hypothetical protein